MNSLNYLQYNQQSAPSTDLVEGDITVTMLSDSDELSRKVKYSLETNTVLTHCLDYVMHMGCIKVGIVEL